MQHKVTKEEKFENLYRTYQNDVYKIALYYTRDSYTAEDIAQKTFYNFYLHSENVREDRIRAYLLRTARNLSFNWTRDSKWELQAEYLETLPEEKVSILGPEDTYLREAHQRDITEFMDGVMIRLREENESWYDILTLVYGLGKKQEDVAYELGISLEVLHSKLYRAKRWIRKKYEKEYKQIRDNQ